MAHPFVLWSDRERATQTVVARAAAAARNWSDEDELEYLITATRDGPDEPRRWQALGLAQRNLDRHGDAIRSFEQAVERAPADPFLTHMLARTTLDAGLPALALFDRAFSLAPLDAPTIQGRAAALFAAGRLSDAIAFLADQLRIHPAWYEGHAAVSRLGWLAGARDNFDATFLATLAERPTDGILWREYALVALRAGRHELVNRIVADARRAVGKSRTLDLIEAAAASEAGDRATADASFPTTACVEDDYVIYQMRHLLRIGRADAAAGLIEQCLQAGGSTDLWPLLGLAWRLVGDPRQAWPDHGDSLIRTYDLLPDTGDLTELAACLRALHVASAAPLDQSLRSGTQTDGPLFSRLDPPLQRLRSAVMAAVGDYVARLPSAIPGHPTLIARRAPLRFAGSWSVRLTAGGHHVDHVHPAGWISSACYIALPDGLITDADRAGWLVLGDAPSLNLSLPPIAQIAPKPGHLVLFPSTMWHRTTPFAAGERLTVAFDIARPPR